MRDKILAQLKVKFPGVNLSKARLNAIADKLAAKITDEAEIDAKLDELNEILPFSEIAKQDDQVRTLQTQLAAKKDPKSDQAAASDTTDDDNNDEKVPKWAKGLIQTVQSLASLNTQTGMQQKLGKELKDIPASFYAKRTLPEKDEDLPAFIEEVKGDYTEFKQHLVNEGLAIQTTPADGSGAGAGTANSKAVTDEMQKWHDNKKKSEGTATSA